MKKFLKSSLRFFIILTSVSVWLFLLIAVPVIFFLESDNGILFFILAYITISLIFYWYFSKRSTLIEDKSYKAVITAIKIDINDFLKQLKEFFIGLFHLAFGVGIIALFIFVLGSIFGNKNSVDNNSYQKGDMSDIGGTPTYRYSDTPTYYDNYNTTDDESNNQPVGFYGTDTMYACNGGSGNCDHLDVDSDGENIERIYFEKGGWVDVNYSDCEDGYCYVEDENGTEWELEAY